MGTPITPAAGTFLVKQDANVRATPKTASKRVAALKKNERIDVVGKGPGAWMAVRKDGADLGFVYGTLLVPLVDGTLKTPLIGRTAQHKDISCIYSARFIGKNPVSGEAFETSDYDVVFKCTAGKQELSFAAYMFIAEAPYQLSRKPEFQINIDVPQFGTGEQLLSTIFLYQKAKERVVFDSVGRAGFQRKPKSATRPAKSVAEALRGAIEMAPMTWNEKALALMSGKGT